MTRNKKERRKEERTYGGKVWMNDMNDMKNMNGPFDSLFRHKKQTKNLFFSFPSFSLRALILVICLFMRVETTT